MSLDAQVLRGVDLTDRLEQCPVLDSTVVFKGVVWDVRRDTVDLGEAGTVRREYVDHPGAVSIVALRQVAGRDQVLLIQQYRHPVGAFEWELPAGWRYCWISNTWSRPATCRSATIETAPGWSTYSRLTVPASPRSTVSRRTSQTTPLNTTVLSRTGHCSSRSVRSTPRRTWASRLIAPRRFRCPSIFRPRPDVRPYGGRLRRRPVRRRADAHGLVGTGTPGGPGWRRSTDCLLYTSDAADE